MTINDLATCLQTLIQEGHGDCQIYAMSDDETNLSPLFRPIQLNTADLHPEDVERLDLPEAEVIYYLLTEL